MRKWHAQPQDPREVFDALDTALQTLNADARQVNPFRPWDAAHHAGWDNRLVSEWIADLQLPPIHERALRVQLENMQAVPVEEQSYLGLLAPVSAGLHRTIPRDKVSSYWTASEVFRCAEGNQQLARALAQALPSGSLHCGTPVDTITVRGDDVVIQVRDGDPRRYHWVVLATPPACWPDRCCSADAMPRIVAES